MVFARTAINAMHRGLSTRLAATIVMRDIDRSADGVVLIENVIKAEHQTALSNIYSIAHF